MTTEFFATPAYPSNALGGRSGIGATGEVSPPALGIPNLSKYIYEPDSFVGAFMVIVGIHTRIITGSNVTRLTLVTETSSLIQANTIVDLPEWFSFQITTKNGSRLVRHNEAWTKGTVQSLGETFAVFYVDFPGITGISFADHYDGSAVSGVDSYTVDGDTAVGFNSHSITIPVQETLQAGRYSSTRYFYIGSGSTVLGPFPYVSNTTNSVTIGTPQYPITAEATQTLVDGLVMTAASPHEIEWIVDDTFSTLVTLSNADIVLGSPIPTPTSQEVSLLLVADFDIGRTLSSTGVISNAGAIQSVDGFVRTGSPNPRIPCTLFVTYPDLTTTVVENCTANI